MNADRKAKVQQNSCCNHFIFKIVSFFELFNLKDECLLDYNVDACFCVRN